MLSQFSPVEGKLTLSDLYSLPKDIYPVGRLDYDSEGLLVLTNDNYLKTKLLDPEEKHNKTYFVQVEGIPSEIDLIKISSGVEINVKNRYLFVKAISCNLIPEPHLPERNPPIRFRKNIPTSWLKITITEGKYHQVRKMTAKIGFPTLRLVRYSIEKLSINDINQSQLNIIPRQKIYRLLNL